VINSAENISVSASNRSFPLVAHGQKVVWKQYVFWIMAVSLLALLCSNLAYAHGMSEAEKQSIIDGGNLSFLWLGATHMLTGYDHLAFVFGIIFFLTSFRDIAKYVTAFTLGHSITLIFATFSAIQINYFLIDAVIALSVCYIAFSNLDGFRKYLNINPPNMLVMILGLGLIHGFGLSTRLQQLPLSEDDLLLNIISFNVGVEFGQISALALMLLLIAAWRKSHFFQTFSTITNYTLMVMGALLFLMQMHGYEHTANADEFGAGTQVVQEMSMEKPWEDTIKLSIPPRSGQEYKVFIEQGGALNYAWKTDGEALFYDFHGEPSGDTSGYFESFEKSTQKQASGSLVATFSGTHGWFWKNNSRVPVGITLQMRGDYQGLDSAKDIPQTEPPESQNTKTHDTID
jgi:hypothetical protein